MNPSPERIGQELASDALMLVASSITDGVVKFSRWLAAGSSAVFSWVFANVDKVNSYLDQGHLKRALFVYVASLILIVSAEFLGMVVQGALRAGQSSKEKWFDLRHSLSEDDRRTVLRVFTREYEKGLFWPARTMAERTMKKAATGGIVASARLVAKLSQIHNLLVLAHCVFAIAAIIVLITGLK